MLNNLLKSDGDSSKVKKTIALSLASGLSTLMSVIFQMITARYLSTTDVAVFRQTFLVYTTISPFLLLGIPSGIYYTFARNEKRIRAVVLESFIVLSSTSFLFTAFILLGGNRLLAYLFSNPSLESTSYLLGPYSFFMMMVSLSTPVLVYLKRINFNAKYHAFRTLFCVGITVLCVYIYKTATSGIYSNVFSNIVASLVICLATLYVLPKDDYIVRKSSISSMLKISIPIGISAMLGTLDTYLDKWIVSIMMNPEEYAIFSTGAHEIPLIGALTSAVTTVVLVDMTTAAKERKFEEALHLFKSASKKTSLIVLPIMCFLAVSAMPFIGFLYTDRYIGAIDVFRVYLLYLPVRTVFYGPIMIALGRSKQILIRSIIEIIANAILSIIFIKLFSSVGASIATIVSVYFVSIPINLAVISKDLKVKWHQLLPFNHYFKCLIFALPGTVLTFVAEMIMNRMECGYLLRFVVEAIVFFTITFFIYMRVFRIPVNMYLKKIRISLKKK